MANLWNSLVQTFGGNKNKAAAVLFVTVALCLSTALVLIVSFIKRSPFWFCIVCGLWFGCVFSWAKSQIKSLVVNGNNGIHTGWWVALGLELAAVLALFFFIFKPDELPPTLYALADNFKFDKQHLTWFAFVYLLASNVMGLIWEVIEGELFAKQTEQAK